MSKLTAISSIFPTFDIPFPYNTSNSASLNGGAWFSYNGQRISQGRENAKRYLEEHPDIMDEIEKKVRDNFAKAFEQSLGEELPSDDEEDTEPIDEE